MNIFVKLLKIFCDIDVNVLKKENTDSQQQIKSLNFRIRQLESDLSKSQADLSKSQADLSKSQTDLSKSHADLSKSQANLSKSQADLSKSQADLSKSQADLSKSQAEINDLKNQKKSFEGDKVNLLSRINDLQDENEELKTSITQLQQQIVALQDERDDNVLLQEKMEEQQHNEEVESESPNDVEQMNDEIDNLKMQIEELQAENKTLTKNNEEYLGKIGNLESTLKIKDEQIKNKEKNIYEQEKTAIELQQEIKELKGDAEIETGQFPAPPLDIEHADIIDVNISTGTIPMSEANKSYNGGIPVVTDKETGKDILAEAFFSQPYAYIFKIRYKLEQGIYLKQPKFVCKYCGQAVRVVGEKFYRGLPWHFSHEYDTDRCIFNNTTTGNSKREINRLKFARCNEGNRHKMLKEMLEKYLVKTPDVSNVKTESTIKAESHPILRWRRPDVQASFRGQDLVFELQLSTTFVSVMAERDLFYRMEHKHIIWVFNFDEQAKYVDLTNMMTEDVYFNNRLNIFIFDKEAQLKSEQENKLYLKCNWMVPCESGYDWKYPNGNTSDKLGGILISLSDLHYDDSYKPYYYNAEKSIFEACPDIQIKANDIEEENAGVIKELNEAWEKQKLEIETRKRTIEEKKKEVVNDYGIEKIIRSTQTFLIGKRLGKCGLVSLDGILKIPFENDEIRTHHVIVENRKNSGWSEAIIGDLISIYDSDFNVINKDILRIEKINDDCKKYVKDNNGDLLWGLMDKKGVALTEPIYSEITEWSSNKVLTVRNGRYCIVNMYGREIIHDYDSIGFLDENKTAEVIKKGRKGRITEECNDVRTSAQKIGDGYFKVQITGKWGIEDNLGNEIVPCKYDEIGSYRGNIIGIDGQKCSIIDVQLELLIPIKVKYKTRDERKKLVFSVGNRNALMNIRQQQKASKRRIKPTYVKEAYISFVSFERDLLYLSALPVNIPIKNTESNVKDSDISIGERVEGHVMRSNNNYVILETSDGNKVYLHHSMWGNHNLDFFIKGKKLLVEKTGFDEEHNKHIWKVLDVD